MKEWLQFVPAIAAIASAISAIFAAMSATVNRKTAKLNNRPYFNFETLTLQHLIYLEKNEELLEIDLNFKNVGKTLLHYYVDHLECEIKGKLELPIGHFNDYGGYVYPTASSNFRRIVRFSAPEENETIGIITYAVKYGITEGKYQYFTIKNIRIQVNRVPNGDKVGYKIEHTLLKEYEFDSYSSYSHQINKM